MVFFFTSSLAQTINAAGLEPFSNGCIVMEFFAMRLHFMLSDCCLAIFQLYHGENKLIFKEMRSAWY